jgi:O-antigen/teichoic acid export membrane protein
MKHNPAAAAIAIDRNRSMAGRARDTRAALSRVRSLRSSSMVWLPAAETLNRGARFLVAAMLARELGPGPYGSWILASALAMIVANGADLGLSTVITARIAADPGTARRHVAAIVAIIPALALITIALLVTSAATLGRGYAGLLFLLGLGGLLDSLTLLVLAPLRAHGVLRPEGWIRALQGAALVGAGVPLLLAHAGIITVASLFPLTGGASFLIAIAALVRRQGIPRPNLEIPLVRRLLRESIAVFAAVVVTLIYFRADSFVLAYLRGTHETGVYGAAYSFAFGLAFVPLMFQRILLPRFAATQEPDELRALFRRNARAVGAVALAVACMQVLAMPLLPLVYGAAFRRAQLPFLALVAAQALYFLTHLNYTLLLARSRNATVLQLTIFALIVNIAANFALAPALGASGAALAAVCSEVALLGTQAIVLRRVLAPAPSRAATDVAPSPALAA